MEEAADVRTRFPFPLWAEGQWDPSVASLKNKLTIYFQSRRSGGGDCWVSLGPDGARAVLLFRTDEVRQRVLHRKAHELRLGGKVLKLNVRLPPSDQDTAQTEEKVVCDPAASSTNLGSGEHQSDKQCSDEPAAVLLENTNEKMSRDVLEMFVENTVGCSAESNDFTVEIIPDISAAVVSFSGTKEAHCFVEKCPTSRLFKQNNLAVKLLERTKKVKLENVPHDVSAEFLELFFAREGKVDDVLKLNDQTAVVTFADHKVLQSIIGKQFTISKMPYRVYPYYDALGTALYGKDRPMLKLPDSFVENLDDSLLRFLCTPQRREAINKEMAEHCCHVDIRSSDVQISPMQSLLKQKGLTAQHIRSWREGASRGFRNLLSKYSSCVCAVNPLVWKEIETEMKNRVTQAVVLFYDEDKEAVTLAGLKEDLSLTQDELVKLVNETNNKFEREQKSITEDLSINRSKYLILQRGGLLQKIMSENPELKLDYNPEGKKILLTGLDTEVYSVKSRILEIILDIKLRLVELDKGVLTYLLEGNLEELSSDLLNNVNAALELEEGAVLIFANSDSDLDKAEQQLGKALGSQCIDVDDEDVLEKPEWDALVTQLKGNCNSPLQKVTVKVCDVNHKRQVLVAGFQKEVQEVAEQLSDFLDSNSVIKDEVDVSEREILKFISEYKKESWSRKVKDCVKVDFGNQVISLTGPRAYVKESKRIFVDLIYSLHFDVLTITQPGAKKFFQEKAAMYVTSAMNETGCVIHLVNVKPSGVSKPILQLKASNGVEITLYKADICQHAVDVVVNSSNECLQHEAGLARALSAAAGASLQADCDKYIKDKGQVESGDVIITGAGNLPCKHVFHVVGPRYTAVKPQQAVGLLQWVVRQSLFMANKHKYQSIAIPAISSGCFGFPLVLCTETIVQTVKDYCQNLGGGTLTSIHLVDNNDKAIHAMEAALCKIFTVHEKGTPALPTADQKPKNVPTQANSDSFQTKEGVTISVMNGFIQDASTKVMVNTLAEDLNLNCGAVSKAILKAAGPHLQNLLVQKAANSKPTKGAVIVTEGCNLKSEFVFHAIAPHWDKGKGTAEKLLKSIMKECLGQAEQLQQGSITFSAIGTGNLGFPKDLVASVMLSEILEFSTKSKPQHLKEVVFMLHPGDAVTQQAFLNEFSTQFSSKTQSTSGSEHGKGCFTKITSPKSGEYETSIGNVVLQVINGDITKETTDVIVNSSNSDFSLKSGVSKAILESGGPAVEAECKQLSAKANKGIIVTQAGNLQTKKIIHIVGQTDPGKIKEFVVSVLQMCAKHNLQSVSFPAFGTGQGGVQASQVADAMLEGLVDFVVSNAFPSLRLVRMVIFQQPMLADFYNSMQKKEASTGQGKETTWSKIKTFASSLWKWDDKQAKTKSKDLLLKTAEVDPATFHICGDSQASVSKAKTWIKHLIEMEQHSTKIADEAVLNFTTQDWKKIQDLQKDMNILIKLDTKASEATLTVEGLSKDVLNASIVILDMLKKTRSEVIQNQEAELISNLVEWQFLQGTGYMPFDKLTNFQLEQALSSTENDVTVTIQGMSYKVTMPNGPAVDSQGNQLKIHRINKLQAKEQDTLPKHWDDMTGKGQCLMVALAAGSPEYNEVHGLFHASCKRNVLKIERVQNPSLWKNYQILKKAMEDSNGHQRNERRLFHGTSQCTVQPINHRGFNRSYAGKNATAFGNGTYFAVAASYSANNTYSVPDPQGQKYMYLSRVLTGEFTVGRPGLLEAPGKGNSTVLLYDSVTDNGQTPSMFIIFNDIQAYPEYLITFQ